MNYEHYIGFYIGCWLFCSNNVLHSFKKSLATSFLVNILDFYKLLIICLLCLLQVPLLYSLLAFWGAWEVLELYRGRRELHWLGLALDEEDFIKVELRFLEDLGEVLVLLWEVRHMVWPLGDGKGHLETWFLLGVVGIVRHI